MSLAPPSRLRWWLDEVWLPVATLGGLSALLLGWSWRRWPDLLIDFGRELYIPWRLANGAQLYRDVDDFYGPLSQYFNAALFRIFGPGMMVLVTANLVVFAAILAGIYLITRLAWNRVAALGSAAVFVGVFGFARWSANGSFNYATPYAHETTHGMMILVLLVLVLAKWGARPSNLLAAVAGGLVGLTLVLKPEIAFAALAVTAGAGFLHRRAKGEWRWSWLLVWASALALPTLAFVAFFLRSRAWGEAWSAACRGWLNVVATTRYVGDPSQAKFMGLNDPLAHLRSYVLTTGLASIPIAWIAFAGGAAARFRARAEWTVILVVMLAGVVWFGFSLTARNWLSVGGCLPAFVVVASLWEWTRGNRAAAGDDGRWRLRILFAVLSASLLVRMALNARIYDFGYYQAAGAAVLVVACLLGEFPNYFAAHPPARRVVVIGAAALIGSGLSVLLVEHRHKYGLIDYPVSEGRDRFYTYRGDVLAMPKLLADITETLRKNGRGQSLLVLPEGQMVNYLTRMPSPLAPFYFFSVVTEGGREQQLVEQLAKTPPDWVLLVARDLREFGIAHYGERIGAGKGLLDWVKLNYQSVGTINREPMDFDRHGLQLFRRKISSAP
jgi:hypothetical protein